MDQTERLESQLQDLYYDLSESTGSERSKLLTKIAKVEDKLQDLDHSF